MSVHFIDALDDLAIHIMDNTGNIMYENVLSGGTGDIINIPLDGIETNTDLVVLTHKLGSLKSYIKSGRGAQNHVCPPAYKSWQELGESRIQIGNITFGTERKWMSW